MYLVVRRWFCGLAAVATLTAAGSWSGRSVAQQPQKSGYREQVQRINSVLAQKAEAEVRDALTQSQNLRGRDPAKAAERLQRLVVQLEDNTALSAEDRDRLIGMVQRRIDTLKGGGKEPSLRFSGSESTRRRIDSVKADGNEPALTEKEMQAKIRRVEENKKPALQSAEDENLRRGLNEIADLQRDGKAEDAKRRAAELAKQYPGSSAAHTALLTASAFEQLASAKPYRKEQEQRTRGALNDVEKSALPVIGDIEFPKDWKERSERRLKSLGLKLTAKERAILQALNTPISVNFKEERFEAVMEYLSTVMNQPILVTKSDLNDASISYDTPVTLAVKGVAARTVLRKILAEFGLTYIIKDESIQIVPQLKAREMMVVRSYYIGDLLGTRGGPGDPLTNIFGPTLGPLEAMKNIASIMEMIQTSVDPSSWQGNNGSGAVFFHYPSMSLIVKQSAEVHAILASQFGR